MRPSLLALVALSITAAAAAAQGSAKEFPYSENGQYLSQQVLNRHFPSVGGKYRGYKFSASMSSLNRKQDGIITYSYQYRGPGEKRVSFWITDFGVAQDSAARQREFSYHLYPATDPVITVAGRPARTHERDGKQRGIALWAGARVFVQITSGSDSRSQDTSHVLSLEELRPFAEALPYDEWDVERTPASLLARAPAPVVPAIGQTGAPASQPAAAPEARPAPRRPGVAAGSPAPAVPTINPPMYVPDAGLDTAAARALLAEVPSGMTLKAFNVRSKRRSSAIVENARVEFAAVNGGTRSVRIVVTDLGRMSDEWMTRHYFTTGSGSALARALVQGQPATTNGLFTKQIDVYVANRFSVRLNGGGGVSMDDLLGVAEQLRFELLEQAAQAAAK